MSQMRQFRVRRGHTVPRRRYNSRNLIRRGTHSIETGFKDTALSLDFDTTGDVVLINDIAQGTSVSERVGKRCHMLALQIRGRSSNQGAATDNNCALMLVYDKRPTGALPAVTDLLSTASSASLNNDTNSSRFQILKRWNHCLTGAPGVDGSAVSSETWCSLRNLVVEYGTAGTGAIGDIENGALYLVSVGNTAAGANAAILQGNCRIRFMDG